MAENRWDGFSDKELKSLFAGGEDDRKLRNDLAAEILRRKTVRRDKPQLAQVRIKRSNGITEEGDVRISRTVTDAGEEITIESPIFLRSGESLTILPGKESI